MGPASPAGWILEFTLRFILGVPPGLLFSISFSERRAPGGSDGKESACNTGDSSSIPVSGRSPGEGNGNPLQYSCRENPMDGGAWQATVRGVTESWT